MTEKQPTSIVAVPGYPAIHEMLASFIGDAPSPRLAAEMVLNASLSTSLAVMGAETLEGKLRHVLAVLPAEDAAARRRLA